ncbi:unnamed protein product [Triticum turgidum subsp. durum]|uniref:Uncharacterized protein n=1 Tax=Triticum turgidum subsp. durum TaxID=4567 RepID=A0A9R1P9E9_TRITD|nr:unnamed protein product [Triticum turgidum subsp. durum]
MGAVVMRKVVEIGEMNVVAYPLARTKHGRPGAPSSSQSRAGKGGRGHVEEIAEVEGVVDDIKVKSVCAVGGDLLCRAPAVADLHCDPGH